MKYISMLLTVTLFFAMIAANYLSTSGLIEWLDMGNLDGKFPFAYMPPGFAFGVSWGLIYILVGVYTMSLLYRINKQFDRKIQKEVFIFALINILNTSWIFATAFEQYIIAGSIIFTIFIVLFYFLKTFGKDIFQRIAFGIYIGWITVATFGLTLAQVVYLQNPQLALTNAFGNSILIFASVVALVTFWQLKNIYALIWSLLAISIAGLKMYAIFF